MKTYNWGIVGCGAIATKFCQSLQTLENANIHAVASKSQERLDLFQKKFSSEKGYISYEELANDDKVDIVYIATPHVFHKEQAKLFLSKGKHVLCEKPLTLNTSDAIELKNYALRHQCFLMEAMWTRFLPAIDKVLEFLRSGLIGEVHWIQADFGFDYPYHPNGRLFNPELGGGALLDVGIYPIALARLIYGKEPVRISSHINQAPTGVDQQSSYTLSFSDTQIATLSAAVNVEMNQEVWIFGKTGKINIPHFWQANEFTHYTSHGLAQKYELPFASYGYQFEAAHVMQCLDDGLIESPVYSLDESIATLGIMDTIRGQWGLVYPSERG